MQGILGHSRIQSTLDLYTDENLDEMIAAQDKFIDASGFEREIVQGGVSEIVGRRGWKHHSLTALKRMAGTTGLEPAASAVTGQRSNQLNYVPHFFSYPRKPACLVAFLRFNRFACVACVHPIELNSEVIANHGRQAQPLSKNCLQANTNPEQLSLPRE